MRAARATSVERLGHIEAKMFGSSQILLYEVGTKIPYTQLCLIWMVDIVTGLKVLRSVRSVGRSVAIFHSWFHVYKGHQLRWWDTQGNDPSMSDETRHSLVHDGCFSPKMRFTLLFILAYSALKSPVSQVRYHLKTLIEQHSNCQLSYAAYKWELCCCCKKLPGSLSWVISTP